MDDFNKRVQKAYQGKVEEAKVSEAQYLDLLKKLKPLEDEIQSIRNDEDLLNAKYTVAEANKKLAHYNELVTLHEKYAKQIDALVEQRQSLNGGE